MSNLSRSRSNSACLARILKAVRFLLVTATPALVLGLLWFYMGDWYQERLLLRERQRVQIVAEKYADLVEVAIDTEIGIARAEALGQRSPVYWQATLVHSPELSLDRQHLLLRLRVQECTGEAYTVATHLRLATIMELAGIGYTDPSLQVSLIDDSGATVYGPNLTPYAPVTAIIRLPDSFLGLAVIPSGGWEYATRHERRLVQGALGLPFAAILSAIHVSLRRQRRLRRHAESDVAALRLSEASFRHLFSSVSDPILVTTLDGELIAANDQATKLFELRRLPATLAELLETRGAGDSALAKTLLMPDEAACMVTLPGIDDRHDPSYLEAKTSSFRGGGEPDRLLIVLHDMTEATQSAQALRESEARYRDLVESSPEGIMLLDIDGRAVVANRQVARMAGYANPHGMLRSIHRFADLVDVGQRAKVADSLLHALKGEPIRQLSLDFVQRSGQRVPVEASIAPLVGQNGPTGFVVTLEDVTERVRIQERNRAYSAKLSLLARSLVALIDLSNTEQAFQAISEAFVSLSDAKAVYLDLYDTETKLLTPCAFAGDSVVERVLADRLDESLLGTAHKMSEAWHQRLLTRGIQRLPGLAGISLDRVPYKTESQVLSEMGVGAIWGLALTRHGATVGAAVLVMSAEQQVAFPEIVEAYAHAVTDLLQQHHAARALQESEERYRSLVTNLGDAVVIIDSELSVVEFRDTASGALEMSPNAVVGSEYDDVFGQLVSQGMTPPLLSAAMRQLSRVYRHGPLSWINSEGQTLRLDAAVFGFRYRAAPHAALLLRDVTEREDLLDRLREHQRLEDLGMSAAGAAHDLRHIVALIKTQIPLLAESIQQDRSEALRMLTSLDRAVLLGESFCTTLIEYDEEAEPMTAPLHINLALEEQRPLMQDLLGPEITLSLELGSGMILALADAGLFERAWLNLLVNAKDAMPRGGRLIIGTRLADVRPEVASELGITPGAYAVVSVSDTGRGMTRDQIERVFDPFFTTKQNSLAAGLGLSVVKRVMDSHNGQVHVTSNVGVGSTFELYFPAISPQEISSILKETGFVEND